MTLPLFDAPPAPAHSVTLTRDGDTFVIVCAFSDTDAVRQLPYAHFDAPTRTWRVAVCAQSVTALTNGHTRGIVNVHPSTLLRGGEQPARCAPATLAASGAAGRPFAVRTAFRSDTETYSTISGIAGATWDKTRKATTLPASAAAALAALVDRGILADPAELLTPAGAAGVTLLFDAMTGKFTCRGDNRAQPVFDAYFPGTDVVSAWTEQNLQIAFADEFSEEVYRGELARAGSGIQPAGMNMELFDYQKVSVAVALARSGFGVFHPPGLGKTIIGVAVGHELVVNRAEVPRALVIAPAAVGSHWREEILRATGCPADAVVVIAGTPAKRKAAYKAAKTAQWVIITYDLARLDLEQVKPLARGALLVADEAHRLKNPTTSRTKAARKLAELAAHRVALTGTPVENDPSEWHAVLSGFAVLGCLGDAYAFSNLYQYAGRFGGFEGARNVPALRERSRPHYIRFTKAEVASHLPPLRVQHLPLEPEPAYAAALKVAHMRACEEISEKAKGRRAEKTGGLIAPDDADEVETGAEMTAVGMLRLMCSSPRLVHASDSEAAKAMCESGLVPAVDGPKLDEIRVMALELQRAGERMVAFTFSRRMATLIAERLAEDGTRYVLFTGETSAADRDAAVRAFCSTEDELGEAPPTVFIGTDAAAEGLNLGRHCSTLVNVDLPWTASRLEQRSNRIHRVDGTAASYHVLNLTLLQTLEGSLLRMLEHKADLSDAVLGEKGGRRKTTGRGGANIFEQALTSWSDPA